MQRERTMKDSGIPWIGEIPEGWKVCRIKDVAMLYNGNSIKDEEKDNYTHPNNAYTYISTKDLDATYQSIDYCNGLFTSKDDSIFKIAHRDSCLMCIEGGSAGKKKAYVEQDVSFVNKLCCFAPYKIEGKYLFYYICSPNFESEFYKYISGLIGGVSVSTLKNFMQLLPPLAEQHLIATFLDKKCSEIDSLIELQEQMIEELKAYKQSVITEAVTKGLNPDAPMRDSGIDWIDTIPNHWIVRKMKSLIDLKSGSNLTSEQISDKDDGYPVYGGNGLRGTYSEYSNEGDYVLVGRQGALCGNINYASGKFWVTEHALVCYPKEALDIRWLGESLRAMNLNQYSLSAAQPGLSAERIKNLYMIVPPLAEQQAIAGYLDKKCGEIEELITIKQQKIESLKEYKKSVIYEYVTGKREV